MHRVIRISIYAIVYAIAFGANWLANRKLGRRPVPLRLLLYATGGMLSIALVEEFHR